MMWVGVFVAGQQLAGWGACTYVRTIVISDKTSYIPERPEGRRDQRDPDSVSFLFVFPFAGAGAIKTGGLLILTMLALAASLY